MLVRVLGPIQVEDELGAILHLRPQLRRLLAALLVDVGKVLSVDRAIDNMWGDTAPSNPDGSLHALVSKLRTQLGDVDVVVSRPGGYLLRVEPDQLDAIVFERLLAEARQAFDEGAVSSAAERLSAAEILWRGSAFEEFAFEEFARVEAARLDQLRIAASALRFDCWLELGRHTEAIPELTVLRSRNQLDERLACQLALALYRAGRQAEALRTIDGLRETLRDELGADPIAETDELYEAMLRHDSNLNQTVKPRSLPKRTEGLLVAQAAPGFDGTDTDAMLEEQLLKNGAGYVFNPIEGVVAATFDDVQMAVSAALALFEAIAIDQSPPRVAVGAGEFENAGGKLHGLELNRTLRVMGAIAPGQVVISDRAALLGIGSLPLGWALLEGEALSLPGVTTPERVTRLGWVGRHSQPLRTSGRARLTNLPGQLTTFVGRTTELGELNRLVDDHRLVTVTGPGGVGKTRLCLQMAADRVGHFPDGVWLVEVAELASADRLPSAVLAAARIQEALNTEPTHVLEDWVETRQMLLVLDDCERLVEPVASLVDRLLRRSPGLRILASSREALGVPSEFVWTVPLLVPPEEQTEDLSRIGRNEVVRLFVERAVQTNPDFHLDAETAPDVIRICRAVEGIPLAVELSAGQLRRRSLAQVAELVERNLHHLESPYRTVINRQRTLAATVDWSYSLLDDVAKQAFQRLSVFTGPLDAAAASAVCSLPESEADRLLHQFADQSLLASAKGFRRMLQPIRSCASELLRTSGGTADTIERHADYFLGEAADAHNELRTPRQAEWIERLARHLMDIQTAIQWGLEQKSNMVALAAIGIADFLFLTRSLTDALHLLDTVRHVEGLDESTRNRIELKTAQVLYFDHPAEALPILELLMTKNLPQTDRLQVRLLTAATHLSLGNDEAASETLVDPHEADSSGDPWLRIQSRTMAANLSLAIEEGDLGAASDQGAYDLAVELKMPWHVALTANNLAWRRGVLEGRTEEALKLVEEGLNASAVANSPYNRAWCLGTQAEVLVAASRTQEALPVVVEAVHAALQTGARGTTLLAQLEILALVLSQRGNHEIAAQVHGAAHLENDRLQADVQHNHTQILEILGPAMAPEEIAKFETEGRQTPIADLLDRASAASETAFRE